MTRFNTSTSGGMPVIKSTVAEDMKAFDKLPVTVRRCLSDCNGDWSPVAIEEAIGNGWSVREIIRRIREDDAKYYPPNA